VTTICILYPDLLGTYGDGGNGLAAVERADVVASRPSW